MLLVIFISSSFLFSCKEERTVDSAEKHYFDLKGLVENQIIFLSKTKPPVSKTAALGEKTEIVKSNDLDWKKELEVFIQADINKPSYAGSYDVIKDDSTDMLYRIKSNVNLPVRELSISTNDSTMLVRATILSENRIYKSQKHIQLALRNTGNSWQLSSYLVDGYQKLVLMDPKTFRIETKIGL